MENLFYPKRKARAKVKLPDEVFAVLQPIIHKLSQGKSIYKDSQEHKQMVELLNNAE